MDVLGDYGLCIMECATKFDLKERVSSSKHQSVNY